MIAFCSSIAALYANRMKKQYIILLLLMHSFLQKCMTLFLVYAWPKLPFDIFINHKILSIKLAYDAVNGNVKIQITSEVGTDNIRIN